MPAIGIDLGIYDLENEGEREEPTFFETARIRAIKEGILLPILAIEGLDIAPGGDWKPAILACEIDEEAYRESIWSFLGFIVTDSTEYHVYLVNEALYPIQPTARREDTDGGGGKGGDDSGPSGPPASPQRKARLSSKTQPKTA